MAGIPAKSLIGKLNTTCRRGMEAAAGLCGSRTHFHVEVEHWLLKLVETPGTDLPVVLRNYTLDANKVKRELNAALDQFKTGNGRGPDLSFEILDAIREAWVLASLEYASTRVRSGHLLAALLTSARTTFTSFFISLCTSAAIRRPAAFTSCINFPARAGA